MKRDAMRCDAVREPALGRRSVLLALPSLAALTPMAAVRAAAPEPGLTELVGADGSATTLARSLAQTQVSVRGYLSPSLDGREFALTEGSAAPCQLCGSLHDAGSSMTVRTGEPAPGAPVFERVLVSGRLEIDGAVRLTGACIQAL